MPSSLRASGGSAGTTIVHPQPGRVATIRGSMVGLVVLLGLAACTHSEPFPPGSVDNPGPLDDTPPVRLTFDSGVDQYPAWLADGAGLLYSYELTTVRDHDRCLGLLPPGGGVRRVEYCATGDLSHDSTNALLSSSGGPGGLTAWVDVVGLRTLAGAQGGGIRVGGLTASDARLVQPLPYFAPNGHRHDMATHLAWLGDSAVMYLGNEMLYFAACSTCKLDTVPVGREIMLLKVNRDPVALEIVPGTFEATSLSLTPDATTLYFTVLGDSVIYRRDLVSGAVSVAHDFGSLGIVRDVSATATSLVAVVGGQVAFISHPQYGPLQMDFGGTLYHISLTTGAATPLSLPNLLARHPAISPDGSRVAVEVTSPSQPGSPDLYLYSVP